MMITIPHHHQTVKDSSHHHLAYVALEVVESILGNREAIEMIDRNSQNVYTRVLNNQ